MSDTLKPLFSWRSAIADSDLEAVTRHVAVALSLFMSERGDSAWPGAVRLAHDTGLSERCVRLHLGKLVAAGWLELVRQGGVVHGKHYGNEYRARVPSPQLPLHVVQPAPRAPMHQEPPTPAPDDTDPCTPCTPSLKNSQKLSGRARAREERGRRIPIPFIVSEGNRAWAAREIPGFDWDKEGPNFVDYWRSVAGAKGLKLDWDATWRTWMRRAASGVFR